MMRMIQRRGEISPVGLLAIASVVLIVGLLYLSLQLRPGARSDASRAAEVQIYCAAGVASPIEQALQSYREEFGVAVDVVRTGGSGKLYGQIETEFRTGVARGADLYVTADNALLEQGQAQGIIHEILPMGRQYPVIATYTQSTLAATSLQELVTLPDVRFGIANENAAIGRLARVLADEAGVLDDLLTHRKLETENVMQLAQALQTRTIDAAIVWETTVSQINLQNENEVLTILKRLPPPVGETSGHVAVGVVHGTADPTAALRVARYLTASDGGLPRLAEAGFEVIDGDPWEEVPEIHLYCGSMFSPVFAETVREFSAREGVNIYPRWEGCGKLVAAMDGVRDSDLFPDGFLSCDRQFLDIVSDRFEEPSIISANDVVIARRRDALSNVASLEDLVNSSLRIGICHAEDSALGKITREIFLRSAGEELYQQLTSRASVISDTGPTLVSQLLSGGLDAAIVYRSNVLADPQNSETLQVIPIDDETTSSAQAVQAWAIARGSNHRYLMTRLFAALTSAESQSQFHEAGFRWLYPTDFAESPEND